MILHPVPGGIQHLLEVSNVIVVTHVIAMVAMPLSIFGYWGLTKTLRQNETLSLLAFILVAFGVVFLFLAGTLNGIVLPLLISDYKDANPEELRHLNLLLDYNTALNKAFDFIYLAAATSAIILWSIAAIRSKTFPAWLGFFGLIIGLLTILLTFSGLTVDLKGFRVFAFGFVVWNIAVGIYIFKPRLKS